MSTENTNFHAPGLGRRVFIKTFGCQMNVADSHLMSGILEASGYKTVVDLDDADVVLVNTCAVRERAEERVVAHIANLKPQKVNRPDLVIGVCGCMAEHLRDNLFEKAPMVDLVVGPDAYRRLPELIDKASGGHLTVDVKLDKNETYDGMPPAKVDGINGWVSIQRGCDKFCSFCIVPFVRGRERSCSPREVLRQSRALVKQGAVELTLLGQTVNSYRYEDADFADLLSAVAKIEGLRRIRFTSPYPLDFSDKLIDTIASEPKVMPYVHLPLQSGSDEVLQNMRRGYTSGEFLELALSLREKIDNVALSTDLIVGFPDESESDFEKTLDLVRAIQFDMAFMFIYSQRSHTYASKKMPDSVPVAVKKERLSRLIAIQEGISEIKHKQYIGRQVPVLVSGPSRRDPELMSGRTDSFKTTIISVNDSGPKPEIGEEVLVEIKDSTSHTLMGDLIRASSCKVA